MPEIKPPVPPSPEWMNRLIAEVKDFYSNLRLLQYEIQDWQSKQEDQKSPDRNSLAESVFVLHKIANIATSCDLAMRAGVIQPPTNGETNP